MIQDFVKKITPSKNFVIRICNFLFCLLLIANFFKWKALRYSSGLCLSNQDRSYKKWRQKILSKSSKNYSGNHPYLAEYSTLNIFFIVLYSKQIENILFKWR